MPDVPTESSDERVDTAAPRLSTRKKLLFATIVVLVPLMAGELLCRITGAGGPATHATEFSDWHVSPGGDRFWVVRAPGYNRDGVRDRDHDVVKPPGVHRIVTLGDSVTAGFGLPFDQSFPFLFQSYLSQIHVPAEVINVAVPGWSTLQEVAAYETIARKYKPDDVFLGFCLNDVAEMRNNMIERPAALPAAIARHSALFRFLVGAQRREVREVRDLFAEPEPPAVADGWRRVFDQLTVLQKETEADGCQLSVIVLPFRFQLLDDAPPPVPQTRLRTWCLEHRIPSIDMLPALRRVGPKSFIDASHLSLTGARAVAEELIRWGRSGCVMCGYDLAGFTGDRCPKCGTPIKR